MGTTRRSTVLLDLQFLQMRSGKFSKTLITIIPLNTGKHATIPQQAIKILLIFTLQLNDQSHILYLMAILFRILSKNQSEMV